MNKRPKRKRNFGLFVKAGRLYSEEKHMLTAAFAIIKKYIKTGDKIALAVSGGLDSVCLLHAVLSVGFIRPSDVCVVNVDHKIRGESSAADSAFVKALCARYGVEFCGYCVDVPALAALHGRSIEQEAREARRDIFSGLVKYGRVRYVLTAHHADDQSESILLHILRGSGVNGLVGMRTLSQDGLLRPFLTTKRAALEAYAAAENLSHVEDETNADTDYTRNYLRREVLPLLREKWNVDAALFTLSQNAAETLELAESALDEGQISPCAEGVRVELCEKVAAHAKGYFIRALRLLNVTADVSRKNLEEAERLIHSESGKTVSLGGAVRARKGKGHLLFFLDKQDGL